MKKIIALTLALLMLMSLAACGEKTSAGENGKEKTTDVKDVDSDKKVSAASYRFNPPADGFSVEFNEYYSGNTYKATASKAGNVYIEASERNELRVKYDFSAGGVFMDDWEGNYGWTPDENVSIEEYSYAELTINEFSAFEEYFLKYFYAFGKTVEDLDYYNIGSETIAGCKCWVFDAMGLNAIEGKFWVNMENGICMKYLDPDGEGFEFTQLNLNYNG